MEGSEEGIEVLHAVDYDDGATKQNLWIDLGEAANVVQRTIDNEHRIVAETLSCYQILSIGNNGAMTDDDTLGFSCRSRSIQNVSGAFWNSVLAELSLNLLKSVLRHVFL